MKIYDITGGWPAGISNGLNIPCGDCGRHTKFDYRVDDGFWQQAIPEDMQQGVVCLACLDRYAKKAGELVSKHLEFVQYTAERETIILKPHTAFYYTD